MRLKFLLLLPIFCILSSSTYSQIFKGRVTNNAGESIPYASLYLREISSGFVADDNGYFHATLTPGTYTCEVSSLGYTQQIFTVQIRTEGLEKNIELAERVYELREVSITRKNEDPAYDVMRKAIAYSSYYRTFVKSYTAGTYLKGTGKLKSVPAILKLSKDFRTEIKKYMNKLFVLEEQRLVSYTAPDTWDNQIKAYTNSFPDGMKVELMSTNINLYQPRLFGKISPLSPGAFSYYRFKQEGCYVEGDYLVNKIKVLPKKDNPDLISGYLYVIEDLWCLSAIDVEVASPGVKLQVKATCKEVRPSAFLVTSISLNGDFSIFGVKAEASYLSAIHYSKIDVNKISKPTGDESLADIINASASSTADAPALQLNKKQQKVREKIEKLSAKNDLSTREAYKLSKLVTKSIEQADTTKSEHKFERKSREYKAKTDSLANRRDSVYWAAVRIVPLKPEEHESYVYKAKLNPVNDSIRKDSTKKGNIGGQIISTLLIGKTIHTKNKKAWITIGDLLSCMPEFNFVDGLWVGAKFSTGIKFSEQTTLHFKPQVYYATSRKEVLPGGLLSLDYAPRRLGKLELSGGISSADFNEESGESRLINSYSSLVFARNDIKLYDKRFVTLSNEIELANSLLFTAGISWQQRRSLDNAMNKSFFGGKAEPNLSNNVDYRPMPKNELLQASFALRYTPAHYYRMIGGKKVYAYADYPTFTLEYKRAFSHGWAGTLSPAFHRMEFTTEQKIDFGMFNTLSWLIGGGTFIDAKNMQFADFKHFATTTLPVTERSFDKGFSLLGNYECSTHTRWVQTNIMWSTPYLLLKYLPFLKKKRLDEALHLRSLVVYDHHPYTELGYSIGIMDIARVGIFTGFDRLKCQSVGISISLPIVKMAMGRK